MPSPSTLVFLASGKCRPKDREPSPFGSLKFNSSFEPRTCSINRLVTVLKRWTNCDVELDLDAIKASGLTPEGPLPGAVFGTVSLRSLDQLLLGPHGLAVVPSSDDKKLVITKRPGKDEVRSDLQKRCEKEITEQLDDKSQASGSGPDDEAKPLVLKDVGILDAITRIVDEFRLPIAVDAAAMRKKVIDLDAKVCGRIEPRKLRESLTKMLEPLGLVIEVRGEVVLITPGKK
jgi:hypothetical protein